MHCELLYLLFEHSKRTRLGRVYPELRCTFGGSSHVFDLSYFVRDRQPDPTNPAHRDEIKLPPDLAIEILSTGQTVGELSRKLRSAIRRGVRLGWLIEDRRREVHVFQPTGRPKVLRVGATLEADDILPGFALPIAELFGWLDHNGLRADAGGIENWPVAGTGHHRHQTGL